MPPSDTKVDEECSPDQLAKDRARLAAELADAKKKFMAVAKRKQQEYTKKVNSMPVITVTLDLKLSRAADARGWTCMRLIFCFSSTLLALGALPVAEMALQGT